MINEQTPRPNKTANWFHDHNLPRESKPVVESKCPICSVRGLPFIQAKDYNRRISENIFLYHKCPSCGLIYLVNVPQDIVHYYQENYYSIPTISRLKRIAGADQYKIEMIKKFVKSGSLLEIGPAFGVFAYQAKSAGFTVETIEMDKQCCQFLRDVIDINAIQHDAPHEVVKSMKRHNVIVLWHVLEHLSKPWECLEALAENLTPEGILVIATPNPEAFQFKILKDVWPHVDAPRHLNLIPANLLIKRLKSCSLKPVMLTTTDAGARSWNRFGWQRYLMNHFSNSIVQMFLFVAGYIVSIPMNFFERRDLEGSAYTIIFQKQASP